MLASNLCQHHVAQLLLLSHNSIDSGAHVIQLCFGKSHLQVASSYCDALQKHKQFHRQLLHAQHAPRCLMTYAGGGARDRAEVLQKKKPIEAHGLPEHTELPVSDIRGSIAKEKPRQCTSGGRQTHVMSECCVQSFKPCMHSMMLTLGTLHIGAAHWKKD